MTWTAGWMGAFILLLLVAGWAVPRRMQGAALCATGIAFLGWAAPQSLAIFCGLAATVWWLARPQPLPRWRAALAIIVVLAVFAWVRLGPRPEGGEAGALLGVAFVTLRLIHVVVERFQGRLEPMMWWTWLRYLVFLPIVIAGPVARYHDFLRDERRRRWDGTAAAIGMERILFGYIKIVTLGEWFDEEVFAKAAVDTWPGWIGGWFSCLRYGWNLYFQFSGYSDVAIGLALVAGYRVTENFSWPFLAANIQEFWQRWHASLSGWCRDYVFAPMLALTRQRTLAILASMLALGLWHELSPRYCLWGLYHGAGIAVCQAFQARFPRGVRPWGKPWPWLHRGLAILATQLFVLASFAITSTPTLSAALDLWATMIGMKGP